MHVDNSTLHRRFANSRPGMDLVTIVDAALPVTGVGVDVLGQQSKDLPLVEEFVLRLVNTGITDVDDMSGFLGLEADHVEDAVTAHLSSGALAYRPSTRTITLTPRGKALVVELESIQPVEVTLPLTFDRLTWQATDYPNHFLLDKKEVESADLVKLPALKQARVTAADIPVERVNHLLKTQVEETRMEVLGVRRVQPKRPKYMPIKLLVYADPTRTEVEIATCIEGDLSPEHDLALARLGGAAKIGITVVQDASDKIIDDVVEELLNTYATQRTNEPAQEPTPPELHAFRVVPEVADPAPEVHPIAVFEHPDYLKEALRSARKRLLIMSPWIRNAVVDTGFLSMLEARLRVGVRVTIAYGYGGPEKQGDDEQAVRSLSNLRDRYREAFEFVLLKNTHAKILIWDEVMITTSFNWLSFRGSRDREYRIEEGMLVRIPSVVDQSYQRYVTLIHEQAV